MEIKPLFISDTQLNLMVHPFLAIGIAYTPVPPPDSQFKELKESR